MAWSQEQLWNAHVIIEVGRDLRMSQRDIGIALMAAMVESGLKNVNHGDRDSLGLFQQRPSQGWGSPAEVMNPIYAATKFFNGLKKVKNRGNLTMGNAAQAVQRSAYPDRYAQRENDAKRMMLVLGGGDDLPYPLNTPSMPVEDDGLLAGPPDGTTGPTAANAAAPTDTGFNPGIADPLEQVSMPKGPEQEPVTPDQALFPGQGTDTFATLAKFAGGGARETIINSAMAMLGIPYSWGGGNNAGPTRGIAQGANTTGFDCSGLVQYALNKAGMGLGDMVASQQMRLGRQVPVSQLQPGDLVAAADGHHIAIYYGNGMMIEAPHTGALVRVSPVRKDMVGIQLSLAPIAFTGGGPGTADSLNFMAGPGGEAPVAPNTNPADVLANLGIDPQEQQGPDMAAPTLMGIEAPSAG